MRDGDLGVVTLIPCDLPGVRAGQNRCRLRLLRPIGRSPSSTGCNTRSVTARRRPDSPDTRTFELSGCLCR